MDKYEKLKKLKEYPKWVKKLNIKCYSLATPIVITSMIGSLCLWYFYPFVGILTFVMGISISLMIFHHFEKIDKEKKNKLPKVMAIIKVNEKIVIPDNWELIEINGKQLYIQ
jgi:hypothetical protein